MTIEEWFAAEVAKHVKSVKARDAIDEAFRTVLNGLTEVTIDGEMIAVDEHRYGDVVFGITESGRVSSVQFYAPITPVFEVE